MFGIVLSLAVSVVKRHGTKAYLAISVMVLFLFVIALSKLALFSIVRDLVRCVCLIAAVYVVSRINQMKSFRERPINEMIVWTGASLLAYLSSSGILFFLISPERFQRFFRMQLQVGLLIGFGVSIGIEICQYLLPRQRQ
jgi:glycopeptide antibiotics resistance protein